MGIAPKTQDFVTEAAQSDMLEIESSKLALTKTDSSQTKAFAERMVKDHTETSTELQGLGGGRQTRGEPSFYSRQGAQGQARQAAKLSGKDFTKEYNELQLAAHKDAVSLLERYGKSGENADLKGFASKHLPHLQQHLLMAQDLNK